MRELPLACSLDAAGMEARLEEMRAVGRSAFLSAQPPGVVRFRAGADTRHRLEQIVAAEGQCCPFLGLDLTEERGTLRLTISAPEGAEPVVDGIVSAFSA